MYVVSYSCSKKKYSDGTCSLKVQVRLTDWTEGEMFKHYRQGSDQLFC